MRGHIRKRGSKWCVVLFVGFDENGKKKYKWFSGFNTKKEAEKFMASKIAEIDNGSYIEPTKETLGNYMERWLDDKKAQIRPGTYRKYAWLVNNHIVPGLGQLELSKLKPQHLQSFYAKLRETEKPLSNRSILHLHLVLHDALQRAVKWGLITRNPADAVDPPKPTRAEMSVWSSEDVLQFLNVARTYRYYIVFLLAVATGMRKGEILGLRWSDVNLETGRLHVRQTLTYVKGEPVFLEPKTEKGKRMVTLPTHVVAALKEHKAKQAEEKLLMGEGYIDSGLVITRADGRPANPRTIDNQWYVIQNKASVPKIRFHDLRHTRFITTSTRGAP